MTRKKITYYPIHNKYSELRFEVMKRMLEDLCQKVGLEDAFPAMNEKKIEGIYGVTKNGGKQFWTEEELIDYFIMKNNEQDRWLK